jgi:hypothetical protein
MKRDPDQDYVITIIQYLDFSHNISFFITTKDFDCLYNWWQKRIPLKVIRESISVVVKRWQAKNQTIKGFSSFKYQVRKGFESFMQLSVGSESTKNAESNAPGNQEVDEVELFMNHFPVPLEPLREEFALLYQLLKKDEPVDSEPLYCKLTALFAEDEELKLKTTAFLKNLAPQLRKPEIAERYRLNYLLGKFHIPDFEILSN